MYRILKRVCKKLDQDAESNSKYLSAEYCKDFSEKVNSFKERVEKEEFKSLSEAFMSGGYHVEHACQHELIKLFEQLDTIGIFDSILSDKKRRTGYFLASKRKKNKKQKIEQQENPEEVEN